MILTLLSAALVLIGAWMWPVAVIDNVGVRYVTIVSLMSVTPAQSQGHNAHLLMAVEINFNYSRHMGQCAYGQLASGMGLHREYAEFCNGQVC